MSSLVAELAIRQKFPSENSSSKGIVIPSSFFHSKHRLPLLETLINPKYSMPFGECRHSIPEIFHHKWTMYMCTWKLISMFLYSSYKWWIYLHKAGSEVQLIYIMCKLNHAPYCEYNVWNTIFDRKIAARTQSLWRVTWIYSAYGLSTSSMSNIDGLVQPYVFLALTHRYSLTSDLLKCSHGLTVTSSSKIPLWFP